MVRKRVARLMRVAGLPGINRRRRVRATSRGDEGPPAPDFVERDFTVGGPDRLLVADIPYIAIGSKTLSLSRQ